MSDGHEVREHDGEERDGRDGGQGAGDGDHDGSGAGEHGHGPPSVGAAAVKKILWFLTAICAVSVLLDLTYDKHGHYGFEKIIGFHAFYGFISCVVLVLAATQMRKIVMRDEDYYDD